MSWNQSVVTNAGVGLLNESLAGHTLTIESAVGGAGTLTEEELAAATDVADQKQTFALLGIEDIEGGKRVGIQITNNGVSESYILHQIGVQARLEYEEAPLTLLIILQDEHGVEIPTEAENPDWLFEIYAVISISNKANITVNIDTSAIASVSYVQQALSNKADTDLSNLDTPQAALANLGAGVRPNLLDNPYFAGGGTGYGFFPVNQKGAASGNTDWLVMFDRWVQFGGQWSLTADGLSISTKPESLYWSFLQRSILDVSQLIGKTATVSVLMSDRLVSATSTLTEGMAIFPMLNGERIEVGCLSAEHTLLFQYYGADIPRTIRAVKLELGENQTLAMQDNSGTWVMLPQYDMDYGAQLLKCQKYSLVCDQPDTRYPGAINFSNGTVSVATPVQMAKLPVFTLREGVGYGVIYGPSGAIQVHSAAVSALGNNHVLLSITAETAGAFNCVYGECSFSLETGM